MTLREFLLHRKLGWLAAIGPLYALASIWISISLSPWFTWRNNAISDLGVHSVAPIFNASLIVCGIMCAVFSAGAILRFRSVILKSGFFLILLASVSLAGIGIFTEDYSAQHMFFSVAFFVLLLLASLALGPYFLLKRETLHLGIAGILTLVIGLFGWAYHVAVGWGTGVAIPEAMTFVPGALWFAMLGLWILGTDRSRAKM